MWAIYRKEMRQYLLSPLAWVMWVVYLVMFGIAFRVVFGSYSDQAFGGQQGGLNDAFFVPIFNFGRFLLLVMIPLLAMRVFAEERQTGTLELLYTYPLTEAQLFFGKFFAAITVVVTSLALTLPQIFFLSQYGEVDWTTLGCIYLGMFFLMLSVFAITIWASSLTNSQVVAVLIAWGACLALWLAGAFRTSLADTWLKWIPELSLIEHFESFQRGVINTNDVLFFISVCAFFVFLTLKQLESRKWRG